jgi:hypothetical protein
MRRVTLVDRPLLIGNEAAELLLDYAALIAQLGRGDSVRLNAIGTDGEDVAIGVLLTSGSTMLVESAASLLPEPDNAVAIAYLTERLAQYDGGFEVEAADADEPRPHLELV